MVLGDRLVECEQQRYSVDYAFTLTISKQLRQQCIEDQYDTVKDLLTVLFLNYRWTCVVELHEDMNTHYHGIISFPLPIKGRSCETLFANLVRNKIKILGTQRKFKQIDDFQGWKDYLLKDITKTSMHIARPIFLNDHYMVAPLCSFLK